MKKTILLGAALALALGGAGCGGSAPQPSANGNDAMNGSDHAPNGMIPANTPNGSTPEVSNHQLNTTQDVALPDGFPTDIPRYQPSARISATMDQRHAVEALSTEDDPTAVMSWYDMTFKAAGYEFKEAGNIGNVASKAYQKDQVKFIVNTIDQGDQHPRTLFNVDRIDLSVE